MSTGLQSRSAARGARPQSLFYRDLSASPASRSLAPKGDTGSFGKSSASALWRENLGGGEHPPPPLFSLEDRIERPSDPTLGDSLPKSLDSRFDEVRSPTKTSPSALGSRTPAAQNLGNAGPSYLFGSSPSFQNASPYKSHGSSNWWSPFKERQTPDQSPGKEADRNFGSPVSGVVQQPQQSGGLLTLPAVREIVRPDYQINGSLQDSNDDGDEWVTAFGFGVDEINVVMRYLETCGPIVRHVPGPGGANWIHVQFQTKFDAQKALYKNGTQINGALILGVKPLDPLQRQALVEKSHRTVFNVLPPKTPIKGASTIVGKASARPYYLQPSGGSQATGPIASPSKSTFSKVVDLIFGL